MEPSLSEYPTLMRLQAYCQANPASLVWYINSGRGLYNPNSKGKIERPETIWRRMNMHYVVSGFVGCVTVLTSGSFNVCAATYWKKKRRVEVGGESMW